MIKSKAQLILLSFFVLNSVSLPIQARWRWYQPAPIVVYNQPSTAAEIIGAGIVGVTACVGIGIAAIVERRSKKRKFKEYVETFQELGYCKEQAKIYAQMALDNAQGLQAVMSSIEQEKSMKLQVVGQQNLMKDLHGQKLQEMSHEHKLRLLTYLVMLLMAIILGGLGFLLYRKNK